MQIKTSTIRAVIGLGNPGSKYYHTRHSIGFRILNELANRYCASWRTKDEMEYAEIMVDNQKIILIKPQTFMNASGRVIPALLKQGIHAENILVVHDELELSFGSLKLKLGGSHRGHNGLKSIINVCGADFVRLRFGIDRPEHKEDVPDYVLQTFKESAEDVEQHIYEAANMIEQLLKSSSQ
ncbi:MAG: aminoacyl-tRNA hydrolase [bacterium]|nr:aminoacyl-tRNA hydrolase [bacterium]